MPHQSDNQLPITEIDSRCAQFLTVSRRQLLLAALLAMLSTGIALLLPAGWPLALSGLLLLFLLLWRHNRRLQQQYQADATAPPGALQHLLQASAGSEQAADQGQNEQYLRLREQYDCLVQQIPAAAVLLLDSTLRCFYAAGPALPMIVSDHTQLIGNHISTILPADKTALSMADIQAALQGRAGERHTENGAKQYTLRIVPLQEANAGVYGVMLLICDRSELLRAYRNIQDLQQQLIAYKQAQAELQARISYVVRTPLNTIDGLTELLFATQLDPQQRNYLETIRQSSSALLDQLKDLLPDYQFATPEPVDQPEPPAAATEPPAAATESPLRIMLVEDHEVNRRVTSLLLEHLGYVIDVAESGKRALELLQAQHYDVILMDIQMPELDGIATTRLIRRLRPTSYQPQIIALTANTMQGDRDYYLQQGLDDYLAKPLSIDALEAALQRCLPDRQVRTQPAAPLNPPVMFDPERLEHLRSMAGEEGDGLVREVVRLFLDTAPEQLHEMHSHFQAGDMDATARTAHRIKSSSAAIGIDSLTRLCNAIEQSIRQGNQQKAAALITHSRLEYEQAERMLHETFLSDQEA
jgi:CheY-like chemotaxis protein/HPt (histidine-containing phosphotransfer) domain-containing protein/signal transduction histidine kinase